MSASEMERLDGQTIAALEAESASLRERLREVEGALRRIAKLPVAVIEDASSGRQSVDWLRVCHWIQGEAIAALSAQQPTPNDAEGGGR